MPDEDLEGRFNGVRTSYSIKSGMLCSILILNWQLLRAVQQLELCLPLVRSWLCLCFCGAVEF